MTDIIVFAALVVAALIWIAALNHQERRIARESVEKYLDYCRQRKSYE